MISPHGRRISNLPQLPPGSGSANATHRHKSMFTTDKARVKMGRACPKLSTKESKSL